MMKNLFIISILLFTITSCTNIDVSDDRIENINLLENEAQFLKTTSLQECDTDPMEREWMQDLIDSLDCGTYDCKVSIFKSEYEGEIIFYSQITDPLCNYQVQYTFYNCQGETAAELNNEESIAYLNMEDRETEEVFTCN